MHDANGQSLKFESGTPYIRNRVSESTQRQVKGKTIHSASTSIMQLRESRCVESCVRIISSLVMGTVGVHADFDHPVWQGRTCKHNQQSSSRYSVEMVIPGKTFPPFVVPMKTFTKLSRSRVLTDVFGELALVLLRARGT